MAFIDVKDEDFKRQEIHLDFGDFIVIETWKHTLSEDQVKKIEQVAKQLYDIINIKEDHVHLIQIGPLDNTYPKGENAQVAERERT